MLTLPQIAVRQFASLQKVRGVNVSYRRGGQSVEIVAVPGKTPFRFSDPLGAGSQLVVSRDWLLATAELTLDGQAITPQRGDQILEQMEETGETRVWEVAVPTGLDEPVWRHSGTTTAVMRIHVQEIAP